MYERKLYLPNKIEYVLNKLQDNGYSAFVCGGCIRDKLMYKTVHDYDVATSAKPEEVIEVFNEFKVIPTGIQHGTVTIIIDNMAIEVTTFRYDGDYSDGRRPNNVTFTDSIIEDLSRRDFTINAIAYNYESRFIDPFGGMLDIGLKTIRCVGNPIDRFKEDGLRIMRGLRFAAKLGFLIEENTSFAIHLCKDMLDNVSKERIRDELCKILSSQKCGNGVFVHYEDILTKIIPEMTGVIESDDHLFDSVINSMDYLSDDMEYTFYDGDDMILRLSLLLHNIGKPKQIQSSKIAYKILKDLKFDNKTVAYATQLVSYADMQLKPYKPFVKALLNKIGEEQFKRLILLQKCKNISGKKINISDADIITNIYIVESLLYEVIDNNECYSLKQLAVNGNDLINAGIPNGKDVGLMLDHLLYNVVCGKLKNDKTAILNYIDNLCMYK